MNGTRRKRGSTRFATLPQYLASDSVNIIQDLTSHAQFVSRRLPRMPVSRRSFLPIKLTYAEAGVVVEMNAMTDAMTLDPSLFR